VGWVGVGGGVVGGVGRGGGGGGGAGVGGTRSSGQVLRWQPAEEGVGIRGKGKCDLKLKRKIAARKKKTLRRGEQQ